MKFKILAGVVITVFVACNNSNKSNQDTNKNETQKVQTFEKMPTIADSIAEAAGINHWDSVTEISFTFNVERNGGHTERSWIWKPKTNDVQMITSEDTIVYNRKRVDSISKNADRAFINDKFWLLAQFQTVWDTGIQTTYEKNVIAPISKDTLSKMTVVYGDDGGYTPGDAYDYFYDTDFKIKEWNYRKSNAPTPSLTTTWEDQQIFNGLEIAKVHKDSTGEFKLYFTNISVK